MKRSTLSRAFAVPAAAALTLGLAACGAENESGGSGGSSASGSAPASEEVSGTAAGVGASSQQAAMQAWIAGFQGDNPEAEITYDPAGSGAGREQFIAGGATAFAGTDSPLDEEELPQAQERCGGDVIEVPVYVSPIAVIYNLEGVDGLNLAPATVAGIFAGQITTWNAPEIAADNPGATLPATPITAVHRSDESGTTANFTDYLAAVAPQVWTYEPDSAWPLPGGEAAQGTSGVVGAVGGGQGTIGYADASQAEGLGIANIGVGTEFVEPSPEAAAQVLEVSEREAGAPENVFAYELARDTTESGTYPIVLVSYGLACGTYEDADQGAVVRAFFSYITSDAGQQAAADTAGSAPLSADLIEEITPAVEAIGAGSS